MAESLPGKDFLPGKNPYVIYKALGKLPPVFLSGAAGLS